MTIDNSEVLHSYYGNRDTFTVDFDPEKVSLEVRGDSVVFKLKG